MEIGKTSGAEFNYKKGKARTEQQHSKKLKFVKIKVLPKLRWNKKRGVLESSKKGSRKKKVVWIE